MRRWRLQDSLNVALLVWVALRVAAIIAVWLVVFLATFLGYITVPMVFLAVFTLAWAGVEVVRLHLKRQTRQRKAVERR